MLIHEFAREGDAAGVLDELAKGTPVDARDPRSDRTPLMEAVASPRAGLELVRLLIERGADVNTGAREIDRRLTKETLEMMQRALTECVRGSDALVARGREAIQDMLEEMNARGPSEAERPLIKENVLSLAAGTGHIGKIAALLDAGADIRYERPHGYTILIDAMHGRSIARDPQLVQLIELLIRRGAELDRVTAYSESALSVASNSGRFDAVRALLAAGADPAPLRWTSLMHAIAFDSLNDVHAQLEKKSDLSARDFWHRTPWLLSLQVGDVAKAKMLLAAGSNRGDRGRGSKTPLMYPIINEHHEMLRWLLSEGLDPNDVDEFGETALIEAARLGATESVRLLIEGGADIHQVKADRDPAIKGASNLEIVRLLIDKGADLNDIDEEMRAALTRLPSDGKILVTREEYLAARTRRFGNRNPEKMDFPFWRSMITSGCIAWASRDKFDDQESDREPVWCFHRFGKSINELSDGRIIEIGGEHEDSYDPDFCIYNDVVIHHGDGTFDIYGYPQEVFPATDFHTATLVGRYIYIIGSLGYPKNRKYGATPVYRLDTETLRIEKVETNGENPGWISRHKAALVGDKTIRVSGGKVCRLSDVNEKYEDNLGPFSLDLVRLVWKRSR